MESFLFFKPDRGEGNLNSEAHHHHESVLNSNGHKLFGNGQLGMMGRVGRQLKLFNRSAHLRGATPERSVLGIPIEELSTAENTPERMGSCREGFDNSSSWRGVSPEALALAAEKFQRRPKCERSISNVESGFQFARLWQAQMSLNKTPDLATVRASWEVQAAKRVVSGECGFYKFAKMLGEGRISQYEQDQYWNKIASRSKRQVVDFLAKGAQTAMYNLTEHMRRSTAISLEKRRNNFDKSVQAEVGDFINFLRGKKEFRPRMVAQMGIFNLNIPHTLTLKVDKATCEWLDQKAYPEVSRFLMSSMMLVGALTFCDHWGQRIWAFAQYLVSFPNTAAIVMSMPLWSTQLSQPTGAVWLCQMAGRTPEVEALLDALTPNSESILTALIRVIASAVKLEVPEETWANAVRARRFANLSTVIKSSEEVLKVVTGMFSLVKEVSQAWVHGVSLSAWRLSAISERLPLFATKVTTLYQNNGVERARIDERTAKEALRLFREGTEYMTYVTGGGAKGSQYAAFLSIWKMVTAMHESAKEYFFTHSEREEPFTIHFIGTSSIGKTVMSRKVIRDLAEAKHLEYDPPNDDFYRNVKKDYWDGYKHQMVVYYDDWLQDPSLRSQECNEIIKVVNSAAYLLNMAKLELKGSTVFTSPFVVLTSNIDVPDNIGVADPTAVRRRRHVVIRMKVKEQFATKHGAIDPNRLPIFISGQCEPSNRFGERIYPDAYEFELLDPWDGSVLDIVYSYRVLLNRIIDIYDARGFRALSYKQQLDNINQMGAAISDTSSSEDGVGDIEELGRHLVNLVENDEDLEHVHGETVADLPEKVQESIAQSWASRVLGIKLCVEDALEIAKCKTRQQFERILPGLKGAWRSWVDYVGHNVELVTQVLGKPLQSRPERVLIGAEIDKLVSIILIGLGGISVVYAAHKWRSSRGLVEPKPPLVSENNLASGDEKTRFTRKGYKIKQYHIGQQSEASSDARALSLVRERFNNAVCIVRMTKTSGAVIGVHGLLIGGKLIAVPYHFVATDDDICDVEVVTNTTSFTYPLCDLRFCLTWKNVDMAIIVMPNHFPSYPKLTNHFVNEKDLNSLSLGVVGMLTMTDQNGYALPVLQMVQKPRRSGEHTYETVEGYERNITIVDSIHYVAQTKSGDCGAPLIWFHPSVSRKILGFHVAGGHNLGASNVLTFELMEQVFQSLNTTKIVEPEVEERAPTMKDGVANISQMGYFGVIAPELQFRQPSKSEIIPSVCHGIFPVCSAPAALLPKGGISPLELGVRKGCQANCILPPSDLAIVESQILDHYAPFVDSNKLFVLSLDEAINGVVGDRWIKPMRMDTSPGFPYITDKRRRKGKKDYFLYDETRMKWIALDRVRNDVERRIECAKKREVPVTLFVDVLKDERRELEKVYALKTRIFNTCPMDLNIAIRMYFGCLANLVMDNHVSREIAVGINYHSEDWGMLYRRLRSNGNHWIAGDYSNYDKTFPRQLMMMVANIANKLYDDGNDTIRITLMETLCNRFHLANRVVYFQTHGNPSGNVLTTIINSFGNMALMRLAWLHLARQYDPKSELLFEDYVALSVYGDDNIATVSRCALWYNMNNISQALEPFGVIYTPPKIGEFEHPDFVDRKDLVYLKRYFREEGGLILAPLPESKIQDICNWIRRSGDDRYASEVNISMAQLEMFHWGREKFDKFTDYVRRRCLEFGIQPRLTTWSYYHTKYVGGSLGEDSFSRVNQDPISSAPMESEASSLIEAFLASGPGVKKFGEMVAQSKTQKQQKNQKAVNAAPKTSKNTKTTKSGGATTIAPTTIAKIARQVLAQPNEKQLAVPSQGERFQYGGKELVARIDDPRLIVVIPLLPGITGASQLDSLSRHHSWVRWKENPIIRYRSLSPLSAGGVWYYRVLHDVSLHDLMDVAHWNVSGKAFIAQKAHLDFSVNIPLSSIVNSKSSPQNSVRGSFFICVYKGQELPQGEFWLQYSVSMGGIASAVSPSTTYKVDQGIFLEPTNGEHIHGIPLAPEGSSTHYIFSPPLPDRQMAREFVRLQGGVPQNVVRGDIKAIVDKEAQTSELTLTHPQTTTVHHTQNILDKLENALESVTNAIPVVQTIVRRISQMGSWVARIAGHVVGFPAMRGSITMNHALTMTGPFSHYDGYVTVRHGWKADEELGAIMSMIPLYQSTPSTAERSVRVASLPIASGLQAILTAEVLANAISRASKQSKIVHKGIDALGFIYDGTNSIVGGGTSGDDDEGNDGLFDPDSDGGPILPDIPEFGDDPESPQQFLEWQTTNRQFGGYVVDNNGIPIVKWLGANYGKRALHVSCPTPKYYVNVRKPWDSENKRVLGCYVEVDREVSDMYILAQCVNWGDDACGSFLTSLQGGTYMGTVARFGGLSWSRSVVKITDPMAWNKNDVHFGIGQSKMRYFSNDEGRACLFWCSFGVVADARIAQVYLENFNASGTTSQLNRYAPDKGNWQDGSFESLSDRTFRSRTSVPLYLEPSCPGFSANQRALYETARGLMPKAVSVTCEAGPISGVFLARYDEQNGWWQHVPLCTISYTTLSSRWKVKPLLGEDSSTGDYVAASGDDSVSMAALVVDAPKELCKDATMCIEIFALNGCNSGRASGISFGSYDTFTSTNSGKYCEMAFSGPILQYRAMSNPNAQWVKISIAGDTSRPTTSVAGADNDIYVAFCWVAYLVKDAAAAKRWVYHENDWANVTNADDLKKPVTDKGNGSYTFEVRNFFNLYKMEKSSGDSYGLSTTTWAPSVGNFRTKSEAPCSSSCPIYIASNRTRDVSDVVPLRQPIFDEDPNTVAICVNLSDGLIEPPPTLGEDVENPVASLEPPPEEGVDVGARAREGKPVCCCAGLGL